MKDCLAEDLCGPGLTEAVINKYAERIENLPLDEAVWVAEVLTECRRARAAEAELRGAVEGTSSVLFHEMEQDVAQVVLDAAEWLKTLWNIGYMGAGHFPATPRTEFPIVEVEDVLKSALLQRIRSGRRPLPFPPPTRHGMPWHEVVESDEEFIVDATLIRDDASVVIGVSIESCSNWMVCEIRQPNSELVVQHQGKGPRYILYLEAMFCRLRRLTAEWTRQILVRERAGLQTYVLQWSVDDKRIREVPLRAMTWDRAEIEAQYWVAMNFPAMYGQIRFVEATG